MNRGGRTPCADRWMPSTRRCPPLPGPTTCSATTISRVSLAVWRQPQARLAAMMLLTLRGTPTLYYGDEIGMENGIIPPEKIQDPQGMNLGVSERVMCAHADAVG